MMRITTAIAMGGVALSLATGPVGAQGVPAGKLDHMICYAMKDTLKVDALVDLSADLQPEFSQKECRVIKPVKFCVPATKIVAQSGSTGPEIVGQALRDDYICYLVKCPRNVFPAIPTKLVGDQFGRRRQGKYTPVELCVPARKASLPCERIGNGKQCGGACPDDATGEPTACRFDQESADCTCEPQTCGGQPDRNGQCGGGCVAEGQACRPGFNAAGKLSCICQPPPLPECGPNTVSGTCGGSCPNPTDQCVGITTEAGIDCKCQPPVPGCKRDTGSNQCGGPCPEGLECVLSPVIDDCRCEPPLRNCGPNPLTGQCDGLCEQPGSKCRFVNSPAANSPGCACVTP